VPSESDEEIEIDGMLIGELGFLTAKENSIMLAFFDEPAEFPKSAKALIYNSPFAGCHTNALASTNVPASKPGLCNVRKLGPGSNAEEEPEPAGLSG